MLEKRLREGRIVLALTASVAATVWAGEAVAQPVADSDPTVAADRAFPEADPVVATADPADVESVDAILAALYDVISGPAGEARDWDRFRSLFLPEGRLVPAGNDREGTPAYQVWSPEDYVERSGPILEERGFYEAEIGRVTERFGNIAQVFSAYESRWTPEDPEPFQRGLNSVQLYHDGGRWWILTVMWDWERPENPLPERYLGSVGGG